MAMTMTLKFQQKKIPVFFEQKNDKALTLLKGILDTKIKTGRKAMKKCLDSLISIEIKGRDAILHAFNEHDSLVLSIY